MKNLQKQRGTSSILYQALCIISKPVWIQTRVQSGNAQFGSISVIFFVPCDLENWRMTLKNNRAPLLLCFKRCGWFRSHQWIKTGVTVRKLPIWFKIDEIVPYDLAIWQMTLKNNRTPLLCYFKLCASFRSHEWIQTGVGSGHGTVAVLLPGFAINFILFFFLLLFFICHLCHTYIYDILFHCHNINKLKLNRMK